MDADSSYGGSDTAQDSHSAHENSATFESNQHNTHDHDVTTTAVHSIPTPVEESAPNQYYHKNEVTLPIHYDETDFQNEKNLSKPKEPHYLSTANLNIKQSLENHSNLEEMSKNYRSTNYLNESPESTKKPIGIENPAFQEDENLTNVKSTFDNSKPYNGEMARGLSTQAKTEEPMTEAVNLELINMKPVGKDVTGPYDNGINGVTGIPVKKEDDAEMGNPYDEYFVPVNEHRKYMRGEKLYLTMDKRNKKSRNKCLCWAVCLCIVAAALIIGILAAVGVIGNHGPMMAKEVTARHFDGTEAQVKGGSLFGASDTSQAPNIPLMTPEPPISIVPMIPPSTDTSMIEVPRALESEIVIDNMEYSNELANKNSTEYQALAKAIEDELKKNLFANDVLKYGSADIEIKIMEFLPGSVVVKYRVAWKFKEGIHNAKDPINEDILKKRISNMLERNNGLMETYHLANRPMTTQKILDLCQIQNNGCEHLCMFDYKDHLDFICTCPEGKILAINGKNCVFATYESVSSPKPEPSPEPEPAAKPFNAYEEPDTTSEPDHTSESLPFNHHYSQVPDAYSEPEPTSEPQPSVPQPEAEPKSEPEPTSKPHFIEPYNSHRPEPESEPEPISEPHFIEPYNSHEHEPESEPEPTSEPEPHDQPKPRAESERSTEHQPLLIPVAIHTQHESSFEPAEEPAAEPTSSPEPSRILLTEPNAEPSPETTAEHSANSTLKTKTEVEILPEHTLKTTVYSTVQPESSSEPEPTPQPELKLEHALSQTPETHEEDRHFNHVHEILAEETTKTYIDLESNTKVEYKQDGDEDSYYFVNEEPTYLEPSTKKSLDIKSKNYVESELNAKHEEHKIQDLEPAFVNIVPTEQPNNLQNETISNETIHQTTTPRIEHLDSTLQPEENSLTENKKFESHQLSEVSILDVNSEKTEVPLTELPVTKNIDKISNEGHNYKEIDHVVESTTMGLISDDKMYQLGIVKVVTPEAEIFTSTEKENNSKKFEKEEVTTQMTSLTNEIEETKKINSSDDNKIVTLNNNQSDITTTESATVPVIIQHQVHIDEPEPKIIGIPTTPTSSENNSLPLERVTDSTRQLNQTHQSYQTDHAIILENMSPFLPEIENDTLVKILHSDEHFIGHPHLINDTESHETSDAKPPSLENDQLNHTNPFDPNPTDTALLSVVPLENKENEITDDSNGIEKNNELKESTTTQLPAQDTNNATTSEMRVDIKTSTQESPSDDSNIINVQIIGNLETTTNIISMKNSSIPPSVVGKETIADVQITTTVFPENKEEELTLPPEIFNNVHSNSFFENALRNKKPSVSSKNPEQTSTSLSSVLNINDISSSTEDLIAMETTTDNLKTDDVTTSKNKNESSTVAGTTVIAETIETATELVSFSNNEDNLTNDITEINREIDTERATTTEKLWTTTIMEDMSTQISEHYEVKEHVADITTTEKLFVTARPTTMVPDDIIESYEDLSVAPLDSSNDISDEEQSVLDKFRPEELSLAKKETEKSDISNKTNKYERIDRKDLFGKGETINGEKDIVITTDQIPTTQKSELSSTMVNLNEVKPVTEDFTLFSFARCASGQFQCVNGTSVKDGSYCILANDRCDSVLDCSDGSDEVNCIEEGCPNNFKCESGQCLKRHLVCDGIFNCNDGSDENKCDEWSCNFDEFSCKEGKRCIPLSWKCDGRSQCSDGSDEQNCHMTQCQNNSFHCSEQDSCIPESWRCDGVSDCANGDDEKLCECPINQFKCQTGGGCISKYLRCDGIPQCADRSDEWQCLVLGKMNNTNEGSENILQVRFDNKTYYPICMDEEKWNSSYADLACQYLGFSGATQLRSVAKPKGSEPAGYYKLKEVYGLPILSQLERVENGICNQYATLTCQEFACGSNTDERVPHARIIGGNKAAATQWPSLTLLYDKKRNIQCTSTLIAPMWAIASYSCVVANENTIPDSKEWVLFAGSTNFFNAADNSSTQVRSIKEIIPHPQAKYSHYEFVNDVVLIQLAQPLTLGRNVSTVCLPNKDIEPRQLCVLSGWGINKPGDANKEQYLHYLPVPIIENEVCNSTKHYNGLMNPDKICAGYTDTEKSPCYNDEGAPLMCFSETDNRWELHGVLSHHDNCGISKHPAVYSSLSVKLRRWITNTIGEALHESTTITTG